MYAAKLLVTATLFVGVFTQSFHVNWINAACKQCIHLNGTYFKTIYEAPPIDYICVERPTKLPSGFVVAHSANSEDDCQFLQEKPVKNKLNYFIKWRMQELFDVKCSVNTCLFHYNDVCLLISFIVFFSLGSLWVSRFYNRVTGLPVGSGIGSSTSL